MIPHLSMKGNPFEIDGTKILMAKKTMHSPSNYIKRENVPFNIFVVELNQLNVIASLSIKYNEIYICLAM